MVPAMVATAEVGGGAPMDRGEPWDGGTARRGRRCGAARHGEGRHERRTGAWWGRGRARGGVW